ncbi:MAG: aldo/keto reductase [Cyanobacteria bacterium P01_G01_bin.67]
MALAWLLHYDPNIVLIPGTTTTTTTTTAHLEENMAAISITLTDEEMRSLNELRVN